MQNKSYQVNYGKYVGLRKIVDYKMEKNKKFTKEYNEKIKQ